MPRVNNHTQKNKPFKAKSKGNQERKKQGKASTKTKSIAKQRGRVRQSRSSLANEAKHKKQMQIEKMAAKNQYLDQSTKTVVMNQLKNETQIKIVVLVPGNKEANTHTLLTQIYNNLQNTNGLTLKTQLKGIPYPALQILPTGKSIIKNKIMIISGERTNKPAQIGQHDVESMMDLIKCADIICPVLSCKATDIQGMQLDPHQKGGAFDDAGYAILNMIRSIGTPTTIGVVQDLQAHELRHHDKIQRLFKRFISSQLGEHDRVNYLKGNQHEYSKLVRQMDTTTVEHQAWKSQRGYMLVEDVTTDPTSGNLIFHGYLKGNAVFANQLVHVTGFDDYEVEKIEIMPRRHQPNKKQMEEGGQQLQQYATSPESLFPFSKVQQVTEDILSGLSKMQVTESVEKNGMNQMKEEQMQQQVMDQSDGDFQDEQSQEFNNKKEEEKIKRVEMQMRKQDQLQFQDEVQYGPDEILREKFKEYQGLKNFKTTQWNELENLPDEYDRIYTFKHYTRTQNNVLAQLQTKAFAYPSFYISVTIKGFPKDKILQHSSTHPVIVTFLLKHQRKMTQIHAKVRRNPYYPSNESFIESNQHYSISMGFRRFTVRPIFSRVLAGTQKTKFIKKIGQDYESYFYCSFYYYNYFPPAPVQVYRVNQFNFQERELSPIMYGTLAACNPLHITLERIILTGYPYKINKRRSTVRFMFFNPKDVKYFKPVQVRSKMGLKGRIQQSLGTHGLMKVLFNDKIKHNDTVCMYLYRRVYPEASF